MSILNKMLRDLAAVRKKAIPITNEQRQIAESFSLANKQYHYNIKKIYGIALILILILILAIVALTQRSNTKSKTPISTPQIITPPLQVEIPKLSKIKLNNLTLKTDNQKTIIDFILSGLTYYYIEHGKDPNTLYITLGNTLLTGNFPLAINNTLIKSIATRQNNNNVEIILTLTPNTHIEELQLYEQPETKLELMLSNPQAENTQKIVALTPPKQSTVDQYQQITALLNKGQLQKAIDTLYILLGDYPEDKEGREMLAGILIKHGKFDRAENILEIGLHQYPDYLPFIKLQSRLFAERGDLKKALEILHEHAPEVSDDPNYFALIAAFYQQLGQNLQAAQVYNQLTKVQPEHAAWWIGLGINLEAVNKKNAAQEAFTQGLSAQDLTEELREFIATKIK
jgi:Flp pilus assembly protein TadD